MVPERKLSPEDRGGGGEGQVRKDRQALWPKPGQGEHLPLVGSVLRGSGLVRVVKIVATEPGSRKVDLNL